ncbi:unnamed protein product, partial [Prunus brigantina]
AFGLVVLCESLFSSHSKSIALFLYKSGTEEVQSHPHLAENFVLELEKRPIGAYHSGGQREREKAVFGKWEIFLQLVENGDVESSIFCDGNLCPCYLSASPLHQCSNPCTYPCPYK